MGRTYSPLTRRLAKWLYPFIDRYEWGIKELADAKPRFAYSKELLNTARASGCFWRVRKLTMTNLAQHLSRELTCFFTSRPASPRHLLMIDIDAHNGEPDAWEAAAWVVRTFFPGAYWETSTNGCGAHVYLAVDVGTRRRVEFNEYAANAENSFACVLAAVVADAGFEAHVCGVYGICGSRQEGLIKTRGKLAKIPRPKSIADMERLEAMPTYDLKAFKAVVDEAALREVSPDNDDELPSKQQAGGEQRDIPVYRLSTRSFAEELMDSNCHYERSKGAAMFLARQLGRPPEIDEVSEFFESQGLGSFAAKPDREKRHGRALRYVEKNFDPAKAGYSYSVGQYLPLLAHLVTDEQLRSAACDAGYPRRLLLQDLDIALGFHVKQTLRMPEEKEHRFTVPVDGMIAWFRSLKRDGLVKRSCNYSKVRAVRLALLRAGMILVLDDGYKPKFVSPNGVGIAKRWGLGENCPQFSEYAAIAAQARPATSRKGHASSYTKMEVAPG